MAEANSRERVPLTADLVVLTARSAALQVLLVERGRPPFAGALALPGGFMHPGEHLEQTARRELAEETGLAEDDLHLEQIGIFSAVDRDPRGRVVTVAFLAIAPEMATPTAGSDARDARWVPVHEVLGDATALAFDHAIILCQAIEHARDVLGHLPAAAAFCGQEVTVAQLQHLYDAVRASR